MGVIEGTSVFFVLALTGNSPLPPSLPINTMRCRGYSARARPALQASASRPVQQSPLRCVGVSCVSGWVCVRLIAHSWCVTKQLATRRTNAPRCTPKCFTPRIEFWSGKMFDERRYQVSYKFFTQGGLCPLFGGTVCRLCCKMKYLCSSF